MRYADADAMRMALEQRLRNESATSGVALLRLRKRVAFERFLARLDPSAIRRRYKRACVAAGLRPVKLHGLRHAAGSVLARSLPLVTVRDVLGHAKLTTTNRYLHSKIDSTAIAAVNAAYGVQTDEPAAAA